MARGIFPISTARLRIERHAILPGNFFFRDDVPGVLLNHVSGGKIKGAGRARLVAAAHGAEVTSAYFEDSGI